MNMTSRTRNVVTLTICVVAAFVLYVLHSYDPMETLALRAMSAPSYRFVITIVEFVLWIALAFAVVRLMTRLLFERVLRRRTANGVESLPPLIQNVFSLSAFLVLFVFIFNRVFPGTSLGALFTTSALFGVILGLALQDTLGNFFSGISLHADRPFQTGDVIRVGTWVGVVESITWRAVKVRTFQNHIVLISHANIAKESIEVFPRDNLNARIIFFGGEYQDSPARVIRAVRDAVRNAPNVSPAHEPIIRVRELGDNGVEYEIKYWLENYAAFNDTDALIRQRIWYVFNREKFTFPFPTRTIHVENFDALMPPAPAGQTRRHDDAVHDATFFERLRGVPIFAPLNDDELSQLACAAVSRVYATGENIIREGDDGSSMFILHHGTAAVARTINDAKHTLAELHQGNFFGEMALLTGEPRTADVTATQDEVEVLEIQHEALKILLDANDELAETLSEVIAARQTGLDDAAGAANRNQTEAKTSVLSSIRRFFNLR